MPRPRPQRAFGPVLRLLAVAALSAMAAVSGPAVSAAASTDGVDLTVPPVNGQHQVTLPLPGLPTTLPPPGVPITLPLPGVPIAAAPVAPPPPASLLPSLPPVPTLPSASGAPAVCATCAAGVGTGIASNPPAMNGPTGFTGSAPGSRPTALGGSTHSGQGGPLAAARSAGPSATPAAASATTVGLHIVPPPVQSLGLVPGISLGSAPYVWPIFVLLDVIAAGAAVLVLRKTWSSPVD